MHEHRVGAIHVVHLTPTDMDPRRLRLCRRRPERHRLRVHLPVGPRLRRFRRRGPPAVRVFQRFSPDRAIDLGQGAVTILGPSM